MAIGSPDKAARLDQLRTYAKVQVWSGFRQLSEVRSDVYDAVVDEVTDPAQAQRLTDDLVADARSALDSAAQAWPDVTAFDRLQDAFADIEAADIVVLQACEDHWSANELLQQRAAEGRTPWGIAYFTLTDVWHAIEHDMLELNLWHGSSANVTEGDDLLEFVQRSLADHAISSVFDEGRIEVSVAWERRPAADGSRTGPSSM
ncbi:MAG: hypothetical protein H0V07_15445 [Propionibacteriales bacterium]|nr:hypothetical protein [Propionibacteriales bacterium]